MMGPMVTTPPRATYLIGPAGVGKTTVMDGLLEEFVVAPRVRLLGMLWAEPLVDETDGPALVGYHLGFHRARFSGTDVLGMAVQRDATKWLRDADRPPVDLYGEGQRLGNAPFLTLLAQHYDLTVVHLTADPEVLDARCAERRSSQNPSWRKASATRAAATARRAFDAGVRVRHVNASPPLDVVVKEVRYAAGL